MRVCVCVKTVTALGQAHSLITAPNTLLLDAGSQNNSNANNSFEESENDFSFTSPKRQTHFPGIDRIYHFKLIHEG